VINYPKITLVTACRNAERFLEATLESVLRQGYPNLEYVLVDGNSKDGTMSIVRRYEDGLAAILEGADQGLYDALNRGFRASNGEIMGWINADDMLLQNSLFTVAEVFSSFSDVDWITGVPGNVDHLGRVHESYHRSRWNRWLLLDPKQGGPQQESTFWRRSLWESAGGTLETRYPMAADFELWFRFFEHADLVSVRSMLAAFRRHGENLSTRCREQYQSECGMIRAEYRSRWSEGVFTPFVRRLREPKVRAVFYNSVEACFRLRELPLHRHFF
jgi:glycosyltransferase involved in cell wall biosynthesis